MGEANVSQKHDISSALHSGIGGGKKGTVSTYKPKKRNKQELLTVCEEDTMSQMLALLKKPHSNC